VAEDVMEGISIYCKSLTSLNLSNIWSIDGNDLRSVLSKVGSRLKALDICHCVMIQDEDVKSIPQFCPLLEYLHITSCSVGCMNLLKSKIKILKLHKGPSTDMEWSLDAIYESEEEELVVS